MSAADPHSTLTHVSLPEAFAPAEMDAIEAIGEGLTPRGAVIAEEDGQRALELRAGNLAETAPRARGTLIAFPSYVLHRVTPVKAGTRKSLVAWISGPKFR